MTPKQEKLEKMRQDMLLEHNMRVDLDFALEQLDSEEKLGDCVEFLEYLAHQLKILGWDITPKDIIERII